MNKLNKIKTLTEFLKFNTGEELGINYPIMITNLFGDVVYYENNDYWEKRKFSITRDLLYCENSFGVIEDFQRKSMTLPEIESILGYKIKIKE